MSFKLGKYFSTVENIEDSQKESDEFLMMKEAEFFKNTTKNTIVLLITDQEMLPFYAPGDYIGGRLQGKERVDEFLGKDCIIMIKSGSQYFRRLSKSSTDGSYNLVCLNPIWGSTLEPVIFDVDIEYIAPVIWHRRSEC